jgi:hypothetical protein
MKTGVSTTPCGVVSRPVRAVPDRDPIAKENDTLGIVATAVE